METKTLPTLEAGEYAGGLWYYEPHVYMPYRYVLGRPGARPLVCIGINPSTAQPAVLAQTDPTMWAAWGTLIEKRPYLPGLMREMVALTREKGTPWVTFGKRSKAGHPHHPLYLRKDAVPEPFDVEHYLDTCF